MVWRVFPFAGYLLSIPTRRKHTLLTSRLASHGRRATKGREACEEWRTRRRFGIHTRFDNRFSSRSGKSNAVNAVQCPATRRTASSTHVPTGFKNKKEKDHRRSRRRWRRERTEALRVLSNLRPISPCYQALFDDISGLRKSLLESPGEIRKTSFGGPALCSPSVVWPYKSSQSSIQTYTCRRVTIDLASRSFFFFKRLKRDKREVALGRSIDRHTHERGFTRASRPNGERHERVWKMVLLVENIYFKEQRGKDYPDCDLTSAGMESTETWREKISFFIALFFFHRRGTVFIWGWNEHFGADDRNVNQSWEFETTCSGARSFHSRASELNELHLLHIHSVFYISS